MIQAVKYLLVLCVANLSEGVNVKVEKLELCEKEERPLMFGLKLKTEGDKQIAEDAYMDAKIDLNDDVMNTVTIFTYDDDKWNFIFSKSDTVCVVVENFMGEFAKDLEKSAGLKSGCPYAKGRYEIKNYALDFSTFKYRDFPPGRVKIRSEFHPKDDEKKPLGCYEVEFTITE